MRLVGTVLLAVCSLLAGFFIAHTVEVVRLDHEGAGATIGAIVFTVMALAIAIGIETFAGWSQDELDATLSSHQVMHEEEIESSARAHEARKGQERILEMLAAENHDLREQLLANRLHDVHASMQKDNEVRERERDVQSREERLEAREHGGYPRDISGAPRGATSSSSRLRRH